MQSCSRKKTSELYITNPIAAAHSSFFWPSCISYVALVTSLRLRQAHAQGSVQFVNDGAVRDCLPGLVLVYDRWFLVDGCRQRLLRHLLGQARLLQCHLEIVRHCVVAKRRRILVELPGILALVDRLVCTGIHLLVRVHARSAH